MPSVVQDAEGFAASGGHVDVTLPAPSTPGNLLVAVCAMRNDVSVTPPAGWAAVSGSLVNNGIYIAVPNSGSLQFLYKIAAGGEDDWDFILTGSHATRIYVQEVSGAAAPEDVFAFSVRPTTNNPIMTGITTGGGPKHIVAAFLTADPSGFSTESYTVDGTGWSKVSDSMLNPAGGVVGIGPHEVTLSRSESDADISYTAGITGVNGYGDEWCGVVVVFSGEITPPVPGPHVEIEGVHIERPLDIKIRMEQNAAGEGYIVISRGDVQATQANFTPGNVVSVTFPEIDPDPIFEFFLEDGDWNLLSSDEEGGEELRFSGRGTLAYLERAIMAAERYDASAVGAVYPAKGRWEFGENATEGAILNKMLMEAQDADRPHQPLPALTWDFTPTVDSNGDAWDGTEFEGRWRVPIGNNLYDEVLRLVAANFISIEMAPGMVLHAYRSRGTDRSSATFASGKVRFEKAINLADELAKGIASREFRSHALSRWGETHSQYAWTTKTGSFPYVHEGYNEVESTNLNTVRRVSRGQMGWLEKAQNSVLLTHYVPYPGVEPDDLAGIYLPGQDWTENGRYWVGDNVTVHTGDDDTDYDDLEATVYAITIGIDENGYVAPVIVELNSPYQGQLTDNGGSTPSSPGSAPGSVGGGSNQPPVLSSAFQPIAEKGIADGYAELDADALVPSDQLGTGGDDSGDHYLADDQTWKEFPDIEALTSMAWVPVMANDPGIVTTHGEAVYIPLVTSEGEAIMVQRAVT